MEELHKPVLLSEVLEILHPKEGESYLDLTAGYAGHAGKILAVTRNYKESVLVDRDSNAINFLTKKYPLGEFGMEFLHEDFYNAAQSLIKCGKTFDMILADFGVSSPQLDNSERGFSFIHDGKLDMRMDQTQDLSAETVVNHWSEKRLIEIPPIPIAPVNKNEISAASVYLKSFTLLAKDFNSCFNFFKLFVIFLPFSKNYSNLFLI